MAKVAQLKDITLVQERGQVVSSLLLDIDEFSQALKEVLDNAIAYSSEGGTVNVRTYMRGKSVVIGIQDSGVGIPETDLPYIFDSLYRVDKARTGITGHSGLGLSIVKKIVELHNGTITAQSYIGEGSLFEIILTTEHAE